MTEKPENDDLDVSVRAGVVEVKRDGKLVGRGHWDGRRVVHPDYALDADESAKLDQLVKESLPPNAWESADGAADEIVGRMSTDDQDAVVESGTAEAWRQEVSHDKRAQGLDHDAVLRAMYELIKRSRPIPED